MEVIDFLRDAAAAVWGRWGEELTKCDSEDDNASAVTATWARLYPLNDWDFDGDWATDQSTGDVYWNDGGKRFKCAALAVATPVVHVVGGLLATGNRVARLVSGYHFWGEQKSEASAGERAASDLARVVATPFSIVGLELASLYGVIRPFDGAKLYATFERVIYGKDLLAPCFQPFPTEHLVSETSDPEAW